MDIKSNSTFRIGEISKMFHIGPDSIRYYEKAGLLHPVRDSINNYRLYTLQDIRTMNTIRELLGLGFSTGEILEFEKDRNLDHVIEMLNKETEVIDEKIAHLNEIRKSINSRLTSINEALNMDTSGNIKVLDLPERECLMITENGMKDNEINYRIAEFTSGSSEKIATIGTCDCYILDTGGKNEESGDYATKAVFFYSPYLKYDCNYILPKGKYLSVSYRGDQIKTRRYYPEMLEYCGKNALEPAGDPIEFCYLDRFETSDTDEYVTELQMRVS